MYFYLLLFHKLLRLLFYFSDLKYLMIFIHIYIIHQLLFNFKVYVLAFPLLSINYNITNNNMLIILKIII